MKKFLRDYWRTTKHLFKQPLWYVLLLIYDGPAIQMFIDQIIFDKEPAWPIWGRLLWIILAPMLFVCVVILDRRLNQRYK